MYGVNSACEQMDVSMPFMGGMEATELIRIYESSHGLEPVPIIALTAHASKWRVHSAVQVKSTNRVCSDWRQGKMSAGRHGRPYHQYVNFFRGQLCFLFLTITFAEPLRRNDLINAINKLAGERKLHRARSQHLSSFPTTMALLREFR